MKFFKYSLIIFLVSISVNAQVGIGTASPNGALEITSTTEGLLIPRVALAATTTVTVATPMVSELVYNTATAGDVTPGYYYLSAVAGPWVRLGDAPTASGWLITGNSDIVDGTNFIGTTNNIDVAFRRQGAAAGKIGTTNTSFGLGALSISSVAGDNTAVGVNALTANLAAGIQNVGVGFNALLGNTTGDANTSIGWYASASNVGTSNNVAVGFQAGNTNNQSNTTMVGFQSGANNRGGNLTALGFQTATNNRGQNNTAVGHLALYSNTHAASGNNVAIGVGAMQTNVASVISNNTAVGYNSMLSIGSSNNTALGYNTMTQVTSGQHNVAIGSGSMTQGNTSFNTALGYNALFNTTGNANVAIGYQAANFNGTGNNSVIIGYQASAANRSNTISIGYQATPTASNQIQLGNGAITSARVQVAWTITSDKRFKSNIMNSDLGLDFIKTLRPVSYFRNNDEFKKTEYGFIAQEVEQALIDAGDVNNGIILKDEEGKYGVRYNDFIPMTVKAVQEQQELIEKLQKQNSELLKINAEILKRLEALESK